MAIGSTLMLPMHCSSCRHIGSNELTCCSVLAMSACQAGTKRALLSHGSFSDRPVTGEMRMQSHCTLRGAFDTGPQEGRTPAVFFPWSQLGKEGCFVVWDDIRRWMMLLAPWMGAPAACSVHSAECLTAEINICLTSLPPPSAFTSVSMTMKKILPVKFVFP